MTEPTDAEMMELAHDVEALGLESPEQALCEYTKRALAKWGTPAVAPWRSAVLDLIDDCPGLHLEQDRWLSRRVKELDFASTPQPTQAQAGAVPLTVEQIKEICRQHIVRDKSKDEPNTGAWPGSVALARAIERAHGIGIKGGQHGPA